ncbi:hypothetical protein [Kitasatospora sp. NPDC093806]|uniref:hypothetical protein n=1 Tax=Kitasatospora sp. NPDC093806 TaxID=3155075 RepID=UPI00341A10B0
MHRQFSTGVALRQSGVTVGAFGGPDASVVRVTPFPVDLGMSGTSHPERHERRVPQHLPADEWGSMVHPGGPAAAVEPGGRAGGPLV